MGILHTAMYEETLMCGGTGLPVLGGVQVSLMKYSPHYLWVFTVAINMAKWGR